MESYSITLFSGNNRFFRKEPLEEVIGIIKAGDKSKRKPKVSGVAFSSLYKRVNGIREWNGYTGLVIVELEHLPGPEEAIRLRNIASHSLQTLLSFVSFSGTSLYVVFGFTLPDGSLPEKREMAELFHAHASRRAIQYLSTLFNCYIEEKKPDLDRSLQMVCDGGIWFNPDAIPIKMEQPLSLPAELTFKEALQKEKEPIERMLPGYNRSRAIWLLYEECSEKVIDENPGLYRKSPRNYLVKLAEKCCASGVPEEDMLKYTLVLTFFFEHEIETRMTVRNIYREWKAKKKEPEKPVLDQKRVQHLRFLEFMKRRYSFRYNVLKECIEYHKYRSYYFAYVPVGRREFNGICVDAHDEGLFIWDRDVKRYLQSNRVPVFNPLEDYLANLPAWDGKDHIRMFARWIHTNREGWEEQFYKWFVYMVAQWVKSDEYHANSTVPVLIGKQGYHKSTFCKMLLPPELRDYYKEQLDIRKKKEVDWCLSRFALINLDEFDSIRSSDHALLKHILQKTEVFEKDATTGADIRKRRIASFIATCNSFDLLSDPTGSRRYICLELTADFDFDSFPDYEQLYAQAKEAIQRQEQYWFNQAEEADIMDANEEFQQIPLVEELFLLYFTGASPEESHEVLSSTEILLRLKKLSRAGFEINQKTRLHMGKSLRRLNIQIHRTRKGSGYLVRQIKWD